MAAILGELANHKNSIAGRHLRKRSLAVQAAIPTWEEEVMRTAVTSMAIFAFWCVFSASDVYGQKGIGDRAGVAQQADKPNLVSLSGEVTSIETGPCQQGTGRAAVGTHVLLKTTKGKELNVHLGPAVAVKHVADKLKVGETVSAKAFRTGQMLKRHYVAQSLVIGDESIELRDENLRPLWAGNPEAWSWRGSQGGAGYSGRGRGNCPLWGSPPAERGPGWGGPSRGGYGRGYGQRAGSGRGAGFGTRRGGGYGRGPGW
jgi:hypothetical protein